MAPPQTPVSAPIINAEIVNSKAIQTQSISAQTISLPPSENPPMDPMQYKGLVGDFVGGVFGTIIAAITLAVVYFTWRTTRRIDYKTKTYQVFAEMMRMHEEIVSSFVIGEVRGRDAIATILSEFSFIYKLTNNIAPSNIPWTLRQRMDISYTFLYYGPYPQTQKILKSYDPILIKALKDAVFKKQQGNAKSPSKRNKVRQFKGHQNRLSHYFRDLYAAYSFINSSDLSEKEKESLGKVFRAKLSNYEQALLMLNIISHLGNDWKKTGLVSKFKPVKNVPEDFFSFDKSFNLKSEFPEIIFEWEERK